LALVDRTGLAQDDGGIPIGGGGFVQVFQGVRPEAIVRVDEYDMGSAGETYRGAGCNEGAGMLLMDVPDPVTIELYDCPRIVVRSIVDEYDFIAIEILRDDRVDCPLEVPTAIL
jgi:hypothetical protein